jgi:ectoine hydroxylase-related dioxygenase (phytanoyl-CoA dioxygenase family)
MGYHAPQAIQSMVICKSARVGGAVTAHQDSTFLVSRPFSIVGVWVALRDATLENGCMHFVPGSHLDQPVEKLFLRDPQNPGHATVFEPEGELVYKDLEKAVYVFEHLLLWFASYYVTRIRRHYVFFVKSSNVLVSLIHYHMM